MQSKLPPYQQLYRILKQQILSGAVPPGALLPSEHELSRQHQITRTTVRRALQELASESLIEKRQGKGSVVTYKRESLDLLSFRGFTEVVGATPHQISSQILRGPVPAEWEVPFFFPLTELEAAVGCIRLDRLRLVASEPVLLEYTFLPDWQLPDFCRYPLINDSLFETLHLRYQLEVLNLRQEIRAIPAEGDLITYLQVSEGQPVLQIYRQYGTNRHQFHIFSILFCDTSRYAIGSTF